MKQCSYYLAGGCHYGESCRFAHGEEMTMGIHQAMGARGHGGSISNNYRGGGVFSRGPLNSNPQMNVVSGNIEIDYDEK